jgi:hypothetical protein
MVLQRFHSHLLSAVKHLRWAGLPRTLDSTPTIHTTPLPAKHLPQNFVASFPPPPAHTQGVLMSVDFGINMGIDRAGPPPKVPTPPGSIRLPSGRWALNTTLPPDTQVPLLRPGPAANDAAMWAWYQKAR